MLIDTHAHPNMMLKSTFDVPLTPEQLAAAQTVIDEARNHQVHRMIAVGTSLPESLNCCALAQKYPDMYASVGIHPNDATSTWREDLAQITALVRLKEQHRIVAIGECGLDFHYPDYNKQQQYDVFRAQIELALEHQLPVIVHTRKAPDETVRIIEEYVPTMRGVIHCFSEDLVFAQHVTQWNLLIGIGATITYPKNDSLRLVAQTMPLTSLILETDAPFLPPQSLRGTQNHPKHIKTIALYVATLRKTTIDDIAKQTTTNALNLFNRMT